MSVSIEETKKDVPMLPGVFRMLSHNLMLRGILETLLGVLLLLKPLQTTAVLTIIIGVFLLIDGFTLMIVGIRAPEKKIFFMINALVLIVLGAFTVWRPIMMDSLWVIVIGVWQIFGSFELFTAGIGNKIWNIFSGVLSLIIGLIFIFAPFVGLLSLIWVLGIMLVISGVMAIISGVKIRSCISC